MISMAPVGGAGAAASYFTKDNYYTDKDASEASAWAGAGADLAGLSGPIGEEAFKAILEGRMPDGTVLQIGRNGDHRPGMDLTFSAPKSLSLLAYVGGDERLLAANMAAVKSTIAWAEKNLAETRVSKNGNVETVKTGNLVVALFQHDTNRNLDPQAHVHAVIANVTKVEKAGENGKEDVWRALHNDQLWKNNTLLGSIYHAQLRANVEALGYTVGEIGKHGTFEIAGVGRAAVEAFSTRRTEILAAAKTVLDYQHPSGLGAVALRTRNNKPVVENRAEMKSEWNTRAEAHGIDLSPIVSAAREASADKPPHGWDKVTAGIRSLVERAGAVVANVRTRVGLGRAETDPHMPDTADRLSPRDLGAATVIASAVRQLSERETSFTRNDLAKAALDLGLPVTIDDVERGVGRLLREGKLILAAEGQKAELTTAGAVQAEHRIVAGIDTGKLAVMPVVASAADAGDRLQRAAVERVGFALNDGQESAGRLILAGRDRIVAVQGIAGSGKSTALGVIADVARAEGRNVIAIGPQNKLVRDLERESGIQSLTIAKFLYAHQRLLDPRTFLERIDTARAMFKGSVVFVDETSMVSNDQVDRLVRLANLLEIDRLAFVGDKRQLGAIAAGKPFEVMQAKHITTAHMTANLRSRAPEIKAAVFLANQGRSRDALAALAASITEAPGKMTGEASERWLALPQVERDQTLLMASGRRIRETLNTAVQDGLVNEGTLGATSKTLTVIDRINLTREEERYPRSYPVGARIEFARGIKSQGIDKGDGTISAVDHRRGTVEITRADGSKDVLRPDRLLPTRTENSLILGHEKTLKVHEGDKIRWTDTDTKRGMFNSDLARIAEIRPDGVTVEVASGMKFDLAADDKMLRRLDLGYAMNTHVLQGVTSNRAIGVIDSRETNLTNGRLFLVNISRVRDGIELIIDNRAKVEKALERNPGDKTSALETIGEILSRPDIVLPAHLTAAHAVKATGVTTNGQATPPKEPTPPTPPAPRPPEPEKPNPERDRSRQLDFGL